MSERLDRKKIKQDEFVDSTMKVFEFIENHPRPFLFGVLGVVVACAAVWGGMQLAAAWDNRNAERLGRGFIAFSAPIDREKAKDDPSQPIFRTVADRGRKAAALLDEAAGGSGNPAKVARYLKGVALLDAGDATGAVKELETAREAWRQDSTLGGPVTAALANAYEAAGRVDKAIDTWNQLAGGSAGFPKEMALAGLGRAQEKAGKTGEAKETYRKIISQYPGSPAASQAQEAISRLGA